MVDPSTLVLVWFAGAYGIFDRWSWRGALAYSAITAALLIPIMH